MFGINGAELAVLVVIGLVVVGPERLPAYAEQLAGWVRTLRTLLRSTKERVTTELGAQAPDVDWASLDPRRYDPRRIVREALLDDEPGPPAGPPGGTAGRATTTARRTTAAGMSGAAPAASVAGPVERPPFDDEAT